MSVPRRAPAPKKPAMLAATSKRLAELAARLAWPSPGGPPPLPLPLERALDRRARLAPWGDVPTPR